MIAKTEADLEAIQTLKFLLRTVGKKKFLAYFALVLAEMKDGDLDLHLAQYVLHCASFPEDT